ncbi:MAG TPA: twin-arginine translocase TatA/TatE family subunit [Solirubrobacteraceae bacterium]|nr:twin-arginine translocase TatA/TatE family subunit [Solirubrobacteraceae bacterium]
MPLGLGVPELLVILVILLVIFGPKRLPQLGRQLGSGMREFRDSVRGRHGDDDEDDAPAHPELGAGAEPPAPAVVVPSPSTDEPDDPRSADH